MKHSSLASFWMRGNHILSFCNLQSGMFFLEDLFKIILLNLNQLPVYIVGINPLLAVISGQIFSIGV